MPDLSNLLGAVYGDSGSEKGRDPEDEAHVEHEPAAAERGPAVPDWADDEHLDAAFAQWKPGPSADASPVEHAFVKDADDNPPPPLADDLAAALSEALVAASTTADDTADAGTVGQPTTRFDFSTHDDEDEDPTEEGEAPQAFAEFQPVDDVDEPNNLSKSEIRADEPPQTEQVQELGEVEVEEEEEAPEPAGAPEDVHPEPEPEPFADVHPEPEPFADVHPEPEPFADVHSEPEPVADVHSEPEPELAPLPSFTPKRMAAAELTAASRVDPEPVAAAPLPAPAPEPTPPASVPVAVQPTAATTPAPRFGDGAVAPTTLPAGTRRWERSDDDILPDKPAKKFFSLSLRRG